MNDAAQPITKQEIAESQGKMGMGKIASAFLATWITSYIMNQFSLHGVNFEADNIIDGVKVSSEVVKSTINGFLCATIVGFTPSHFLAGIVDAIRSFRRAFKKISDAANDPLPPQE